MKGVPVNEPYIVFGYNTSVVNVASILEPNLPKNQLGICDHTVREASGSGIWKKWFVKGTHNIENFLTNVISVIAKDKEVEKWISLTYLIVSTSPL